MTFNIMTRKFYHLLIALTITLQLQLPIAAKAPIQMGLPTPTKHSGLCSKKMVNKKLKKYTRDTPPRSKSHFSFAAMGDTAYYLQDEAGLTKLIDQVINKEKLAFVVHLGDQQNDPYGTAPGDSSSPSSSIAIKESQFIPKRDALWKIKHPFLITPGDNDWSDTIRSLEAPVAGLPPYPPDPNPLETLENFRNVYYRSGTNVKFPFKVVSQPQEQSEFSDYIENKRWIYQDIVFVTIHAIGGNNGLEPGPSIYPQAIQAIIDESLGNSGFQGRIAAGESWLSRAFDVADAIDAKGIVIFTHAPTNSLSRGVYDFRNPTTGFEGLLRIMRNRTLLALTQQRQVLLCFADGHLFTVSKPLPIGGSYPPTDTTATDLNLLPNFTAIQVPGSSFNTVTGAQGRVKVTVDFNSKGLFNIYSSVTTR